MGSNTKLHVLDYQECSAEIYKWSDLFVTLEQVPKSLYQLILTIFCINQVLLLLYYLKPLLELNLAILTTHVNCKLAQITTRNINHVLLGHWCSSR